MSRQSVTHCYAEILDLKGAADFLWLSQSTVKDLADQGAIPAVVIDQEIYLLLRDDLTAYVRGEGRRQAEKRRNSTIASAKIDDSDSTAESAATDFIGGSAVDRVLRLNDVLALTSISRASVYRMLKAGQFPMPLKIGCRNGWLESDVVTFIAECKRLRLSQFDIAGGCQPAR